MQALAPSLELLTELRHLDLSGNSMGGIFPEGTDRFRHVRKRFIVVLNIARMNLYCYLTPAVCFAGADGIVFLHYPLSLLTKLQHLNLSNNLIGLDGAMFLTGPLSCLEHLTSLYLQGNQMCNKGITALASTLHSMKSRGLRILDLSNNHLDVAEARAMRELIGSEGMTVLKITVDRHA